MTDTPKPPKAKKPVLVYTLLAEVGRKDGDGLPAGSTGAGLLLYAPGTTETEAVNDSVLLLKQADLAVLTVTAVGTLDERLANGEEVGPDERALMDRALAENSVVVAQVTPFDD